MIQKRTKHKKIKVQNRFQEQLKSKIPLFLAF